MTAVAIRERVVYLADDMVRRDVIETGLNVAQAVHDFVKGVSQGRLEGTQGSPISAGEPQGFQAKIEMALFQTEYRCSQPIAIVMSVRISCLPWRLREKYSAPA